MHVNERLGLIKSLVLSEAEITQNWTDKYYIVSLDEKERQLKIQQLTLVYNKWIYISVHIKTLC